MPKAIFSNDLLKKSTNKHSRKNAKDRAGSKVKNEDLLDSRVTSSPINDDYSTRDGKSTPSPISHRTGLGDNVREEGDEVLSGVSVEESPLRKWVRQERHRRRKAEEKYCDEKDDDEDETRIREVEQLLHAKLNNDQIQV